MTGQELAVRTQQTIELLNHPAFLEQVEQSLPENVSLQRFVRIAATAIRSQPDLVDADQGSLFGAIVKCAQDGLYPDGRDAALVLYKGKVGYIPMIGGFRKIAAEYGWTLRTRVVYSNDTFEYTEEPPTITHQPVRPGQDRGALVASYAIATHRDGRRLQTVLHPEEVAKRRKVAQTDRVWQQWEPQMWEKTAGRDIFGQLPLAESDRRVHNLLASDDLDAADAAALLYGEDAREVFTDTPAALPADVAPAEPSTDDAGAGGQQDEAAVAVGAGAAASSPGDPEPVATEAEPEPEPEPIAAEAADAARALADFAAGFVPPNGQYADGGTNGPRTLREILDLGEDGERWLGWALRNVKTGDDYVAALHNFTRVYAPALYQQALAAKEAA